MQSTMLIADDSEINRAILKLLFDRNFTILEANNGREVMETLESCRGNVDVVLLDLSMPEMDGFQVLREMRRLEYAREIPVVVITGSGTPEDQIKAFAEGANDYVNKPFIPEIVQSRIENVMASHNRLMSIELEAAQLKTRAELDAMTSLYNKMTAENMIRQTLWDFPEKLHALIVIDIDNFKSVNDISGHLVGDHVIRVIADLISSEFRKSDIVGRFGGDEFIVMMQNVPSMDIVRDKVNELVQLMKYKPNLSIPENVTLSIGFGSSNCKATSYEELLKYADEALYIAKANGKARYQEYGVEPVQLSADHRPAALLLSRNRDVCSTVQALVPKELRVLEALSVQELSKMEIGQLEQAMIIYVDVTRLEMDAGLFWKTLGEIDGLRMSRVLAICAEGELNQYRPAMLAGVADIISAPLDRVAFKRRTQRILKQAGMIPQN